MKLLDKVYQFEAESKKATAEDAYKAFGTTREEHQKRMLKFINKKLEEERLKKAEGERK